MGQKGVNANYFEVPRICRSFCLGEETRGVSVGMGVGVGVGEERREYGRIVVEGQEEGLKS